MGRLGDWGIRVCVILGEEHTLFVKEEGGGVLSK